ncbi:MAG: hypothetical protein IT384_11630 [Deltaproteobacteria bacterium]|nr:hypothetical protein [Deltaproteobacteria bacterium]
MRALLWVACLVPLGCSPGRVLFVETPQEIDWVATVLLKNAAAPLDAGNVLRISAMQPAARPRHELLNSDAIVLGWSADQLEAPPESGGPGLQLATVDRRHRPLPSPAWRATVKRSGDVLLGVPADAPLLTSELQPLQGVWQAIDSAVSPSPRYRFALTYEPGRGRAVLFGGNVEPLARLGDTWALEHDQWRPIATSTAPAPRALATLAPDPPSARVVLFGGYSDSGGQLGDTWALTGDEWVALRPSVSPPQRSGHGMVWDAARARIVLFGGVDATLLDDTWELVGNEWARVATGLAPEPRRDFGMFFHPTRGTVVVLGGQGANSRPLGDAWEYDGTWRPIPALTLPEERSSFAVASFDSAGEILLHGGVTSLTVASGETLLWDGAWRSLDGFSPTARRMHSAIYDVRRGAVVMFGGLSGIAQTEGGTYVLERVAR